MEIQRLIARALRAAVDLAFRRIYHYAGLRCVIGPMAVRVQRLLPAPAWRLADALNKLVANGKLKTMRNQMKGMVAKAFPWASLTAEAICDLEYVLKIPPQKPA